MAAIAVTDDTIPAADTPPPPAPPAPGDLTTTTAPPVSAGFAAGESAGVVDKLNANAARSDLLARYIGARAIADGLNIVAGDAGFGLTAYVAPGHAFCDGIVEVAVQTAAALGNNMTNYLWLLRTGAIQVQQGTTDAPLTPAVYLGAVVTATGVATAVSTSGVLFMRGGTLFRATGDAAAPADSPPAGLVLLTRTTTGVYLWTGFEHLLIRTI